MPTWDAIPTHHGEPWDDLPRARLRQQRAERHVRRRARVPARKARMAAGTRATPCVLVDELATNEPGNLNKGIGLDRAHPRRSRSTKMCDHWGVRPQSGAPTTPSSPRHVARAPTASPRSSGGRACTSTPAARRIAHRRLERHAAPVAGRRQARRARPLHRAALRIFLADACRTSGATRSALRTSTAAVADHAADAARYGCLYRSAAVAQMQAMF